MAAIHISFTVGNEVPRPYADYWILLKYLQRRPNRNDAPSLDASALALIVGSQRVLMRFCCSSGNASHPMPKIKLASVRLHSARPFKPRSNDQMTAKTPRLIIPARLLVSTTLTTARIR